MTAAEAPMEFRHPQPSAIPPRAWLPAQWRPWPWSRTLLRGALASVASGWLAGRAFRGAPWVHEVAPALFLSVLALRWLAGLPGAFRWASRRHAAGRFAWVRLDLWLIPAELVGLLKLLASMAGGCWSWATRRPVPRAAEGLRLEDRRKGMYDAIFALNAISVVVEMPVLLLILSSIRHAPAVHIGAHALEALLVMAIFGDRWLVHANQHLLTSTQLDLHAGARAAARIPLECIEAIRPLGKEGLPGWCREHGVHGSETGVVSVLDRPNVVVTVRAGTELTWSRLQVTRPVPRHLFLYIDSPQVLIDGVEAAKRAMLAQAPGRPA